MVHKSGFNFSKGPVKTLNFFNKLRGALQHQAFRLRNWLAMVGMGGTFIQQLYMNVSREKHLGMGELHRTGMEKKCFGNRRNLEMA
jgi:hypothetical protein